MDSLPPAVRQALAELKLSSRASVEALIEAADGEEAKRGEEDTGRVADTSIPPSNPPLSTSPFFSTSSSTATFPSFSDELDHLQSTSDGPSRRSRPSVHSSPLTDSIASVSMRPPTLVGNSFDDRVQLWLGHLRAGTTQRDILELFREERIEVLETVVRTRFEPCYALVIVSSLSDANLAISRLNSCHLCGVRIIVDFANFDPSRHTRSPFACLPLVTIKHLPPGFTERDLASLIESCGSIAYEIRCRSNGTDCEGSFRVGDSRAAVHFVYQLHETYIAGRRLEVSWRNGEEEQQQQRRPSFDTPSPPWQQPYPSPPYQPRPLPLLDTASPSAPFNAFPPPPTSPQFPSYPLYPCLPASPASPYAPPIPLAPPPPSQAYPTYPTHLSSPWSPTESNWGNAGACT